VVIRDTTSFQDGFDYARSSLGMPSRPQWLFVQARRGCEADGSRAGLIVDGLSHAVPVQEREAIIRSLALGKRMQGTYGEA
jgi:hypothetical protein